MKKHSVSIIAVCVAMLSMLLTAAGAKAEEVEKLSGRKFAQLARGGILYDNWMEELSVKIDRTHPSYPADGKKNGPTTWRCKECHGWDYKGKAGAYAKGSHFTGITGIRAYANQNPEDIVAVLKNDTHALNGVIPDDAIEALSLFVAYGQIDVDLYVDRITKKSIGDPASGGRIFLATCTKCHGADGKEMNFGSEKEPEYVGTIANQNPWEALHKIRWGQPGAQMISLHFLGLKEQLDVLSFCQTLPEK